MEASLIEWVQRQAPRFGIADVGIGDDAAVLAARHQASIVTADTLMEGVHFRFDQTTPQQIGHKALAVNLSDLAAMGVQPLAVLVSLTVPRQLDIEFVKQIYEGMFPLARQFETEIIGGDTNCWDGPLSIAITAIGLANYGRPWLRSDGLVDDVVLVTGTLGGSLLGKHLNFTPLVELARHLQLHYSIHAATDITDGLARDLHHIAQASGCGAIVELGALPISVDAARLAETSEGRNIINHVLNDGEDFELLLTTSATEADRLLQERPLDYQFTAVGRLTQASEFLQRDEAGNVLPLSPGGYQHG